MTWLITLRMLHVHVSRPCFNFTNIYSPLSGQGVPTSTQVLATCNSWNSLKRHHQERKTQHVIFGQNHLNLGQAMDKIFGQLIPPPLPNWLQRLWWKSFIGLFIQWTHTDKMPTLIWSQSKCYTFQLQIYSPLSGQNVTTTTQAGTTNS